VKSPALKVIGDGCSGTRGYRVVTDRGGDRADTVFFSFGYRIQAFHR